MTDEELMNVRGGFSKGVAIGVIGVLVTFLIGMVDGYLRPLSCNRWVMKN